MKILINERLSKHRCKTPEGYLICTDAILARTGKQTYRKNEIFKDSDDETEIEVDRTEDEVFSPQTLASFENKPVTVEHPDEDVNVHNYKEYAVGFVRDVHRGEVDGQPVILGNLVITDEQTIQEIENGEHTDLSCGYDCDIADETNPCQRNIRGNHVALCEQGRAGIARIVDSKCKDFDDTRKNIRVVKEFIEQNGNKFDKHKDADAILEYIKKRTGIANADYGDVLYIIKEYTRAEITDSVKDANHLPAKVKRDLQNFLNHKSTFIRNKDYDIAEFVKEFERIAKLWAEFPVKVVRESIKGWFKTGDGMMRKDYTFSIEGYDDRFMVSIYAKPDTYETTELNAYFTDSVKDEARYVVYADGTWNNYRALFAKLQGSARYSTEAEADIFTEEQAKRFTHAKGKYKWIMKKISDSMKDIEQTFRVLALVPGDYDDEPGFDIIFNVKANSENEAITKAKKYAEKIPAYRFAWDFRIAKPNQRTRIECNVDSVNDALILPTKEAINKFESLLRILNIKIDTKVLTTFGRVHYQVQANMPFDQFVKTLDRIDDEMDKLGIPMTFNAGSDGKTCSAGIDLDKQYVKDSQRAQRIQKIIKVVKSIK